MTALIQDVERRVIEERQEIDLHAFLAHKRRPLLDAISLAGGAAGRIGNERGHAHRPRHIAGDGALAISIPFFRTRASTPTAAKMR